MKLKRWFDVITVAPNFVINNWHKRGGMMTKLITRVFSGLILVAMILLALSFAVINLQPIEVNYYLGTQELPLAVVMVGTLLIGAILGVIATLRVIMRLKLETAKLRYSAKLSEREISSLRTMTAKGAH